MDKKQYMIDGEDLHYLICCSIIVSILEKAGKDDLSFCSEATDSVLREYFEEQHNCALTEENMERFDNYTIADAATYELSQIHPYHG